ncbi:hypothetical protein BO71DRAFT_450350 [Aspergillus ellipticus CBS 707.79]|uniref:Zn(2)-C6 fungal-type domain-containing protein n=1 Tax=Aspergillus ellipticus CBS 707.79 TaxID=1448320 RepID=A0A319DIU7_9EURO|nr:hypothetical protein BO71DRAFT_450350 [Aspergillus ellipticus CBS 707.79]
MSSVNAEETIQARRHRLSAVSRACEGCKIRKIRCDRTVPCANCQASKITCRHPDDKSRSQAQADKIANLESLVERLETRLCNVESKLEALEPSQPTPLALDAISQDVPSSGTHPTEGHPFEGNLSFTNQSLQASESAQLAAISASTGDGPTINHSFHQLQKSLRDSSNLPKNTFFFSQVSFATTHPDSSNSTCCPCYLCPATNKSDLSLVESLCQRVYSTSDLASAGDIASMHGVFYFVLKECIAMKDELSQKFDLATYLVQCEQNFIAAIESYEVLAVPSFENILALTMGMLKAQGEAKPHLYWNLVSTAVTHCQSLGYHRKLTYRSISSGKAESIRRLFWTVYTFDKNMSLVLGRVSNMQNLEIDTHHPTVSTNPALRAWDKSFLMGIRLAELQGRIFDGLYSTATMARATSERARLISDLAITMEKWHFELKQINSEGVNSPPCYNAACHSLRAHLDCFPRYQGSQLLSDGDYFNWILLSSSFIPFIVIFLHSISSKNTADVILLEQVVSTFKNVRNASCGSERLYQICATFTHVARRLVHSQERRSVGMYESEQDAVIFPDTSRSTSSLFNPDIFQDKSSFSP